MPVAVLWHLHQPEYRDPVTGIPVMPWTRLHGLRGYLDLLTTSVEHEVPWTVNIVPGLWDQLEHYANGGTDEHLELTRVPADALDAAQVAIVRRTFPCGHPRMRSTPRYRALEARIEAGDPLSVPELRDLQVLSTLVWCGAVARRDPAISALFAKGEGFTEADKQALLEVQGRVLAGYPDLLAAFAGAEGPALSTTPLHHPILPLLIDLGFSARSVHTPPPTELALPAHARLHLERGRARMEGASGRTIRGCWPSEGAVCPELVPMLAEVGFRWVATDEGVLARSEREGAGEGGWDLGHGVVGFFRDRALSDRVGFDYARHPAEDAVEDFFERAASDGVKVVALDGENPWEAFPDAGEAFLAGLVEGLRSEGITLDAAAERPVVGRVDRLHTGSWIGANLEIWAGHAEDHRAWALLADTVEAVGDAPEAVEPLLAAEGSDWFWWYGVDQTTPSNDDSPFD
ncbi:MAG: glycoside hydrolase, partial [Myxococcales bacterium]|nr:glycoside hydrolase [Myxococcales bacterium]